MVIPLAHLAPADLLLESVWLPIQATTAVVAWMGNQTDSNKRSAGARWASGITIPAGATITVAYIQFVCESSSSGTTCNVSVWGNDVASPTAPTTVSEYWGLVKTTAQVDWNDIPAWVAGTAYQTPSLV